MLKHLKYAKYYFMSYDKIIKREDEIAKRLREDISESETADLIDEIFNIIRIVLYRNRKDKEIMNYAGKMFGNVLDEFK